MDDALRLAWRLFSRGISEYILAGADCWEMCGGRSSLCEACGDAFRVDARALVMTGGLSAVCAAQR